MKLHLVNAIYASILIVVGLVAYFLNESRPPTALITPLVGLLLLACTKPLKRNNRFMADIVTVITLLVSLMTARLFAASLFATPEMVANLGEDVLIRRAIIFGLITFSGFLASGYYVVIFMRRRRNRQIMEKKNDT